ncbi:AaceriACR235Wp [[Ashbya] aceris (nom. inval.)]|nr:AaceriACR235Wp [[Ashbya] aceris (nom. inval.)]
MLTSRTVAVGTAETQRPSCVAAGPGAEAECEADGDDAGAAPQGEDVIPTAIVIKNIPFAIKKEQLLEVIAKMDLPLPYAFNYHFDNGVFRGLAFANFTTTEETMQVVQHLNGKEIGGRRLRVEYKKMLPQAERERIEREKREKRGQLEEQHRSVSNVSLQSMGKMPSATVLAPGPSSSQIFNSFVNGPGAGGPSSQAVGSAPLSSQMLSAQSTAHSVGLPKPQSLSSERYYAPLPATSNLMLAPQQLDFNDPDVLEIYSQLLLFKDRERQYHELAYPLGLSAAQKRIINVLCSFLGLVEVYDPSFILIRRKVLDHATLQSHLQQQGQATATQPLQAHSTGDSLQRSQSYTSVLQVHAAATVAAAQQQQRQSQVSSQQMQSQQVLPQPPQSPGQILLHPIASYDGISSAQQQQQQLLRSQGTTPSLLQNRIPSGYATTHTPSSSLLRQHGVSPPQNQVPMNSSTSTSRMANLLYNTASALSQPNTPSLGNDSRFPPGLQPPDSGTSCTTPSNSATVATGATAPLAPQHTNGSVHSNYSVHSIHDYVPISSAGNEINALEEGLTRSLSGLDIGKRNVWG